MGKDLGWGDFTISLRFGLGSSDRGFGEVKVEGTSLKSMYAQGCGRGTISYVSRQHALAKGPHTLCTIVYKDGLHLGKSEAKIS